MRVHGLAVLLLIASLQAGVISDTTTVIPTRNADDCPVYPDTITVSNLTIFIWFFIVLKPCMLCFDLEKTRWM